MKIRKVMLRSGIAAVGMILAAELIARISFLYLYGMPLWAGPQAFLFYYYHASELLDRPLRPEQFNIVIMSDSTLSAEYGDFGSALQRKLPADCRVVGLAGVGYSSRDSVLMAAMLGSDHVDQVICKHAVLEPANFLADEHLWRPDFSHREQYRRLLAAEDPPLPGTLIPNALDECAVSWRALFETKSANVAYLGRARVAAVLRSNLQTVSSRMNSPVLLLEYVYREDSDLSYYAPIPDLCDTIDYLNQEARDFAAAEPQVTFLELPGFRNNPEWLIDGTHFTDAGIEVLAQHVAQAVLESPGYRNWLAAHRRDGAGNEARMTASPHLEAPKR